MRHSTTERRRTKPKALLAGVSLIALAAPALLATPATAFDFDIGEVSGAFDTTISAGLSFRVEDRANSLVGISNGGTHTSINGDDGNLNYDTGLVSAALRATHELDLQYDDFGFFGRFTYFYDFLNSNQDSTEFRDLSDDAIDRVGRDIELLDAYVFGGFDVGDVPIDFRVGNQVLSWGESTFIQNGINIINPIDVNAIRIPGSQIRDALTPVPIVDVNVGITNNLSLEGFYQVLWEETEIDAAGTFFSTNDFASPGGGANGVYLGFGNAVVPDNGTSISTGPTGVVPFGSRVQRGPDNDARDDGQFGFAARYYSEELNDTEFGLYFINYHSRTPVISAVTGSLTDLGGATADNYADGSEYIVEYPEDIQLLGASFNTNLGSSGLSLQGEYSYRIDQPLQVDDVELLQAALAPAAITATGGAAATVGLFNTNQIIQELGGITAANASTFFEREISGFRELDVSQLQFTMTQAFDPIPALGVDQWLLVGEVGGTYVHDMPGTSELRFDGPNTTLGGNCNFIGVGGMPDCQTDGFADDFSWGYRLRARFDILNAIGPINLFPVLGFSHDVSGTTPLPLGNFIEDRASVSIGLNATYLEQWSAGIQYTNFFAIGNDEFNQLRDRDFVSFNIRYSF